MTVPFLYACIAALVHAALGEVGSTNYQAYNKGELGHRPFTQYHSIDQYAPVLQVTKWDKAAVSKAGSHIFMRHDGHDGSSPSSPLILDASDLSTVFVNRSFPNVFAPRIQENFGKKYFTFWAGKNIGGFGDGFGLAYDDSYRLVYNISAHNPNHVDLHEFAFTGHGSALVAAVEWLPLDSLNWTNLHASRGARILDSRFQEIDLETNKLLFDWRASDHINPLKSMEGRSKNWDAYHLNSIQKTKAGNYLVSMRHLHSILMIDGRTGEIIWTFGGKMNMFTELPTPEGVAHTRPLLSHVRWQHHARYVAGTNETQMTVFDNYVKRTSHEMCVNDCSRGLHIAIDDAASPPTVQLLGEYVHPARIQAQSQGSVQPVSPPPAGGAIGNIFVGWGHCPSFTEHTSAGETVLDVQFSPWGSGEIRDSLDNYRAYKMDWSAAPYWDPALAVEGTDGNATAYVSWNGATEVREWVVHAGKTRDKASSEVLARSPRTGFETTVALKATPLRYVWAEALDKDGHVLRSSKVVYLEADGTSSTPSPSPEDTETATATATAFSMSAVLVSGIGALVAITGVVGVCFWRRRSGYSRLEGDNIELDAEDDDSVDVDLEYLENL